MSGGTELPSEAYAAALADLPGMGPARLVGLLRQDGPPVVWRRVLAGSIRRRARPASDEGASPDSPEAPAASPLRPASGTKEIEWAAAAARTDVARRWAAVEAAGIQVRFLGGAGLPSVLADDPEPPGVLFCLGNLDVLTKPCVAIVGTRRCTGYGRSVARGLGHDLADCGVCVVSGLALGIDGAAHEGALWAANRGGGAGPLGVAASGVDVPYPRSHRQLWEGVAQAGAIISETPPGRPAQSWRFPARNRLIAGISRVVVVVESHTAGGSMLTVAAAAERGIEVLAVPGPVTSAASAGTNQLLHEGLAPARHAGDVLAALGDLRPWPPPGSLCRGGTPSSTSHRPAGRSSPNTGGHGGRSEGHPGVVQAPLVDVEPVIDVRLEPVERRVLEAVDRTPTATGVIAERTGLPLAALSTVLLRLEGSGMVRGEGMWWERCR